MNVTVKEECGKSLRMFISIAMIGVLEHPPSKCRVLGYMYYARLLGIYSGRHCTLSVYVQGCTENGLGGQTVTFQIVGRQWCNCEPRHKTS